MVVARDLKVVMVVEEMFMFGNDDAEDSNCGICFLLLCPHSTYILKIFLYQVHYQVSKRIFCS